MSSKGFPNSSVGKESACQFRRCGFHSWVRKIPWRRKWLPTPVFLPGKSHGQMSLVGYSLWGHKKFRQDLLAKSKKKVKIKETKALSDNILD